MDDVVDPDDKIYAEYIRRQQLLDMPITDADRWAYVRDYLAQEKSYCFGSAASKFHIHSIPGAGSNTFTEAIDKLIRQRLEKTF